MQNCPGQGGQEAPTDSYPMGPSDSYLSELTCSLRILFNAMTKHYCGLELVLKVKHIFHPW